MPQPQSKGVSTAKNGISDAPSVDTLVIGSVKRPKAAPAELTTSTLADCCKFTASPAIRQIPLPFPSSGNIPANAFVDIPRMKPNVAIRDVVSIYPPKNFLNH